jgi:hypothetical protein
MSEIVTVDTVDVGINSSMPSNKVTWSTGRNVRFTPGYVSKTMGKTLLATLPVANLPIRAAFEFMGIDGNLYIVACCDTKVYLISSDFTSITDITPSTAPTGSETDLWQFTIVCGLPIMTNGKDAMWQMATIGSRLTVATGVPLCKFISACMNRLVGSYVYMNSKWWPGRTVWSEMGNPLNFVINTTRKSGQQDLMDYTGDIYATKNILCQLTCNADVYYFTLKDLFVCDFSKTPKQFIIIDPDFKLLSSSCACAFDNVVYAMAKDNIYKFVNRQKSVIGDPQKTNILSNINQATFSSSFCFPLLSANEIWFCIPTGTNSTPDTAFVYNWELSGPSPVWSILDCDFTCHSIVYPPQTYVAWLSNDSSTVTWTNLSGDTVKWLSSRYNSLARDIVGDTTSHILLMDSGFNALDTTLTSQAIDGYIETGDFVLGNRAFEKIIEELYPDIAVQLQTNSLMVKVGTRQSLSQEIQWENAIQWSPEVAFRIGVDSYCDLRSYTNQAAYLRLRFYTNTKDSPWSLSGFSFTYSLGGKIR